MKQKFKQIIALFAISSLIILSGCTQEKEFVNEHNHPNIDFKEKSFKEALNLPLFNDALKKVAKQSGALRSEDAARTALEDQYGFTIVTDAPMRIITDENGTVFYTILIEREVKEELIFENLMIKVQDEETTAAIFKYTLTQKGEISETGDYPIKGISNTVFTDLNIEGKIFFNANGQTCFDSYTFMCDDPYTHVAYGACFNNHTAYTVISSTCMNDGNTGTIPLLTNGSVTVVNGGGVPNEIQIPLTPIPCKTGNCIELDIDTPCEELEKFYNIPEVITFSGNLVSNLNQANESGFQALVSIFPSSGLPFYSFYESNPSWCSKNRINWPESFTRYAVDHTHTIAGDSYQMFSPSDVFALYEMRKKFNVSIPHDDGLFFVSMTVDGYKYAIKIDDFNALENVFLGLTKKDVKKMDDKLNIKMFQLGSPNDALLNDMATKFLFFCKDFGIKLYSKPLTESEWKEVKLNENESNVIEIPCSN